MRIFLTTLILLFSRQPAQAQTADALFKVTQLQALAAVVRDQGLSPQWYWSEALQKQIESAVAGGDKAQVDKLVTQATEKLAADLYRGRALPTSFGDAVRIKAKVLDKKIVAAYLNGQADVTQTLAALLPQNSLYQTNLSILSQVRALKANWVDAPAGTALVAIKVGSKNKALVQYLRAKLSVLGYANDLQSAEYNPELQEVVKKFQLDRLMPNDGAVGKETWTRLNITHDQLVSQAMINIDRVRWLPSDLGASRIVVNLAAQHLVFTVNGEVKMSFKTVNGRPDRQTPLLVDSMTSVVLNPTWTVPYSIFVKDKLEHIRDNVSYLEKMHLKVIDDVTNREVNPRTIDWDNRNARNLKYTLVQSPGPWNALGFIKFPLQNPYAIYLHDTDSRQLFDENMRLLSSGCVRVQQPFEMAELVLNNPQYTAESLRAATELNPQIAEKSTWLKISQPVPVYLIYQTLVIEDGRVITLPDFYKLDEQAFAKMN